MSNSHSLVATVLVDLISALFRVSASLPATGKSEAYTGLTGKTFEDR